LQKRAVKAHGKAKRELTRLPGQRKRPRSSGPTFARSTLSGGKLMV